MLVLEGTLCNLEGARSRLSHDWLGNKLLALEEEDIVRWHTTPSAAGAEFERRLLPGGLYDEEMRCLRTLVEDIPKGYSPARVIERGPLSRLPEDAQEAVKAVLHQLYLSTSLHGGRHIEALQSMLREAAVAFVASLDRFREVWFAEPRVPAADVASSFRAVRRDGRALRDALDCLPRGFVLP